MIAMTKRVSSFQKYLAEKKKQRRALSRADETLADLVNARIVHRQREDRLGNEQQPKRSRGSKRLATGRSSAKSCGCSVCSTW